MVDFHRALVHHDSENSSIAKAESLRAAQLELMQNSTYRHPFYWWSVESAVNRTRADGESNPTAGGTCWQEWPVMRRDATTAFSV
jgi:hypothetical protein